MVPVKNARISQVYGRKDKQYRKGYHTGLDIVADGKDKTIYAARAGTVIKRGVDPKGWGNFVIARQTDGHEVCYAHLDIVYVKQGQVIAEGDKIGVQGSTGNSTGPHLHFEVWEGNWEDRNDINAAEYLGIANEKGPAKYAGSFPDVPPDNWAASAVEKVVDAGVMGGHPDGKFHGKSFCTRYELASALDRLLQLINK